MATHVLLHCCCSVSGINRGDECCVLAAVGDHQNHIHHLLFIILLLLLLLPCSVSGIDRDDECCVLAAVGEGMVDRRGVAATMMGALAKANVNIKAIAQVCVRQGGKWRGGGRVSVEGAGQSGRRREGVWEGGT
jgi:hypothetical protein